MDFMLKKITFVGCIFCLFFSCIERDTYRIKVNLSNLKPQNIYAVYESAELKTVDTIAYDGKGAFIITPKHDDYRTLTLYYENFTQWITVYLEEPQQIVISGNASSPQLVQVKGGRINELLVTFRKETTPLLTELYTLSNENDATQEDFNGHNRIARLANIHLDLRFQAEDFINKHPAEKASAILIREYFVDPDNPFQIDNLLGVLSSELDDFYVVQDLKSYAEKAKQTVVGAKAPDFNVRNIEGKMVTRDSFANRYFLMAFTSMWSDECHTKELHLDEIITSFPKDSLYVLLVSLDESPHELRTLIRKEPIQWDIVPDSLGQAIELLDLYNVNVLPRGFLIDKAGQIILKTENGVELKQMLEQLIRKDKN